MSPRPAATPLLGPWPDGWPPLDRITDQDVETAVRAAVAARAAALAEIRDDPRPPAFADVTAIELAHAAVWPARQVWSVLLKTAGTPERHALDAVITPLLADSDAAAWLDPALYARVAAVHGRRDELGLDHEDRLLLERVHKGFRRAGAHLGDRDRAVLRTLTGREAELETAIEARLAIGLDDAAVHVTDRAELAGLDDDEVADAARAADRRGLDGWLLTLAAPAVQPILARLENPALRRRVHAASVGRCSHGDGDTRGLVLELFRLRARRARLLGYRHHADLVLTGQTAGSVEAVRDLLRELVPHAVRLAAAEDAALPAGPGPVAPWDRPFLARHAPDSAGNGAARIDVREYLPLTAVLDGVRSLVRDLFEVRLRDRVGLPAHVPATRVWEAVDAGDRTLGLILLDLHRRPGKRAGAWTTEMTAQSRLLRQRAVVCVSMNLPAPRPDGEVLLTPDQAATVWHEIGGHAVHAMLSQVRYPADSGFSRLPRDVVEAASVVMEMWALDPALLAGYARHHLTGAPLPAEALAGPGGARCGVGHRLLQDLATSLLDLAWHSIGPDDAIDSVEAFERQVLADAGLAGTGVPPRYLTAFFRHVLVGGYDARYYSYTWCDVLAALLHKEDKSGARLRELMTLGALAADRFPAPDPTAFLRRLGITD
ncbi:M3 family metallopeptidase [Saccharothrix sp. HUAS TT1]|uniref:M3 family metallopeptidase n=1 Tax=unclassified Saccharothrix TaxID=2593673 RepID=UPI00345BA9AF